MKKISKTSFWYLPNQKEIKCDFDCETGILLEAILSEKTLTFKELYIELVTNYAYYVGLDKILIKFIENGFENFIANDWFVSTRKCLYIDNQEIVWIEKKDFKDIDKIAKRKIKEGITIPSITKKKFVRPLIMEGSE